MTLREIFNAIPCKEVDENTNIKLFGDGRKTLFEQCKLNDPPVQEHFDDKVRLLVLSVDRHGEKIDDIFVHIGE